MANLNALANLQRLAGIDGVTPSLDDEIKRLANRYGIAAVKTAVKRLPKRKAGRKAENDLVHLEDWFEQDADAWLDGLDPFAARKNYAMAKRVADLAPKHYYLSTQRRVMRKLAIRRKSITLILAWQRAEKSRPYADYLKACDALIAHDPKWRESVEWMADNTRGKIERYKARYGDPDPCMTLSGIDEALNAPMIPDMNKTIAGLLGAAKAVVSKSEPNSTRRNSS